MRNTSWVYTLPHLLIVFVVLNGCTKRSTSAAGITSEDPASAFVSDLRVGDPSRLAVYKADPAGTVALARKVLSRAPAATQSADFILVLSYIDGEILQSQDPGLAASLSQEVIAGITAQPRDDLSETAFGHAVARSTEYHLKAGEDSKFKSYVQELAESAPEHFVAFAVSAGVAPMEMGLQRSARSIAGVQDQATPPSGGAAE